MSGMTATIKMVGNNGKRCQGEFGLKRADKSGAKVALILGAQEIEENKISYFKRTVPGMNLFQIFVKDPNGITIELNYFK